MWCRCGILSFALEIIIKFKICFDLQLIRYKREDFDQLQKCKIKPLTTGKARWLLLRSDLPVEFVIEGQCLERPLNEGQCLDKTSQWGSVLGQTWKFSVNQYVLTDMHFQWNFLLKIRKFKISWILFLDWRVNGIHPGEQ